MKYLITLLHNGCMATVKNTFQLLLRFLLSKKEDVSSLYPLPEHSVGDLHEAGDVCACDKVALHAELFCGFGGVFVDVLHDAAEPFVNLLKRPGEAERVLGHFKSGGGNAAGICSLCGTEEDAALQEGLDSLGRDGHIFALVYRLHADTHK